MKDNPELKRINDATDMEIKFWLEYVQTQNNRIKDKKQKPKLSPIINWKKTPEVVKDTLNQFKKEYTKLDNLSNTKLLREIHHSWCRLDDEINKLNIQILKKKQI